MFVVVGGTDKNEQTVKRSWHLLAEGDDGPFIPSMAIEAIVRKALDGHQPAPGARPAVNDLELADYEALFANRTIHIGTRNDIVGNSTSLFMRLLGSAWQKLPTAVRQIHTLSSERLTEGRCTIERGPSLLSNWVASLFGFPKAADDLPVSVCFQAENGNERWTRKFGDESFLSTLRPGLGRSEHLLCERIGVFNFAQALVVVGDRLQFVLRRWTIFGIPLPLWLAPRSNSYETEQDGRFRFHVEISHPLTGLIVRYRGWLVVTA
jgi:hypothetical protein